MSNSARIPRRWLVAWIAAAATGALVLVTVVSSRGSDRRPPCRGTLIPAYITPAAIADLVDGPEHRRLIVINPASGPGHAPHTPYREAVAAARDSGAQVVGYVPTGYGARDPAAVEADIDRYREWYGVNGVFLDEAAHDEALLSHYRALSLHAREAGVGLVVLNPGVVPAEGYFDLADVVVTYEGPATAYADASARTPAWVRRLAARPHRAPGVRRFARAGPGRRGEPARAGMALRHVGRPAQSMADRSRLPGRGRSCAEELRMKHARSVLMLTLALAASCPPAVAVAEPIGSPPESSASRPGRRGAVRWRRRGTRPRGAARHQARERIRDRCRPRNGPDPRTQPPASAPRCAAEAGRSRAGHSRAGRKPVDRRRPADRSSRGRRRAPGGPRARAGGAGGGAVAAAAEPTDASPARERHSELFDAAYAQQVVKLERLREAVRGRVALGAPLEAMDRGGKSMPAVGVDRREHRPATEPP